MNIDDIDGLYYITHIANLSSICEKGILSHARAEQVQHESIAKPGVVGIRSTKSVPGGRPLLEYVNLYFNPRNPMMYKVTDGGKKTDDIILLKVDKQVLTTVGTVMTDGNAARSYTRFHPSPLGLACLDRNEVFIKFWNDDNPVIRHRLESTTCSEVLVPDRIDGRNLIQVILPSAEHEEILRGKIKGMELMTDKALFFR